MDNWTVEIGGFVASMSTLPGVRPRCEFPWEETGRRRKTPFFNRLDSLAWVTRV